MLSYDKSNEIDSNEMNKEKTTTVIKPNTVIKDKALSDIVKGDLESSTRNMIKDFVYKFNKFNRQNNFDLKIKNETIRRYYKDNLHIPQDLIYVSSFSEKAKTPRFIQFFLPKNAVYIILNHLYGGDCSGEYKRSLSKTDTRILKWYFNFFNEVKDDDYPLIYEITMDMMSAYPLEQLFTGMDIVIGYLPVYMNEVPITEGMLRINMGTMGKILSSLHERRKTITSIKETTKEGNETSFYNRKATNLELDEIVDKILRQ